VRVVDMIGIGHCVKKEVLTLEVARDDEGLGLFRGSIFIPERARGVLDPWGCNHNLFLSAPGNGQDHSPKSRCRFRRCDDTRTRNQRLSGGGIESIEVLGHPAWKYLVQWLCIAHTLPHQPIDRHLQYAEYYAGPAKMSGWNTRPRNKIRIGLSSLQTEIKWTVVTKKCPYIL
jgi:hypothetical protein